MSLKTLLNEYIFNFTVSRINIIEDHGMFDNINVGRQVFRTQSKQYRIKTYLTQKSNI